MGKESGRYPSFWGIRGIPPLDPVPLSQLHQQHAVRPTGPIPHGPPHALSRIPLTHEIGTHKAVLLIAGLVLLASCSTDPNLAEAQIPEQR